jgi:hypothetical protein
MEIDFSSLDALIGEVAGDASPSRKRSRRGGAAEKEPSSSDVPAPMCPALEPTVTAADLIERVRVTESEATAIERYEQGSEAWLLSRRGSQTRLKDGSFYSDRFVGAPGFRFLPGRLTASNFGTAVGHNKYSDADALVKDMLWGLTVSNDAMRYGNETEPVACAVFETAMFFLSGGKVHVEHRGLMVACPGLRIEEPQPSEGTGISEPEPRFEGWCGTSPDGIVHWAAGSMGSTAGGEPGVAPPPTLLEIKCPSVNRRTFYSERQGNERFGIPHYYYDQIQGIMGLQRLPDALFVVYLPDRTEIAYYAFDRAYFEELMRGLRAFWFDRYLPAAVACAQGRLRVGECKVKVCDQSNEPAAASAAEPAAASAAEPAAARFEMHLDDDPEAEARRMVEMDAEEAPRTSTALLLLQGDAASEDESE